MNVADSQRVASALEALGYQAEAEAECADVIVLNTCVVRQSAEDKAYGRLTSLLPLKRKRPDLVINLMGCLVGVRGAEALRTKLPMVDVFSPPSEPGPLVRYLLEREGHDLAEAERLQRFAYQDEATTVLNAQSGGYTLPAPERGRAVSAHVPIVYGCSHACTFCIIPFKRGVERSRPVGEVAADVRGLVAQGVREVTLLGQIVDRYGQDIDGGPTLAGLLRAIHDIDGLERIRFLTGHPRDMHRHLMDAIGRLDKVCPWLHVPAQSGADPVLRRMKRLYTAREYLDMVAYARRVIPGVTFSSDFIVGFPGETDADFRATLDLVRRVQYDQIFSFKYSERPGVPAARLADDVPLAAKKERLAALMDAQQGIWAATAAGLVGGTVTAVCEGPARRPAGAWRLRTANNRKVVVEAPDLAPGQAVDVRLTGWDATTFFGERLPA